MNMHALKTEPDAAVEAVVDRHGREHHELAGRAKDMGSAAVFLADMNVLACWGLILAPRWLAAHGGA